MLRVAAVLAAVLLALVHVGCFTKPGAPQLTGDGGPSDANGSGSDGMATDDAMSHGSDAGSPSCTLNVLADFTSTMTMMGCPTGLGYVFTGTGAMTYFNGTLNVALPGDNTSTAGCTTPGAVDVTGGVAVQIINLPSVNQASMWLQVGFQNGFTPVRVELLRSSTTVDVVITCPGGSPMTTTLGFAPPYWLHVKDDGAVNATIDVGVSGSATSVGSVQQCVLIGSAGSATVQIAGGAGSGSSDTVSFDNLEVCP